MSQTSNAQDDSSQPPSGNVGHQLRCLGCGQNLQSIDITGECPNCKMPVHRTLRNSRIMYADPDWVRGLFQGAKTMMLGMVLLVLCLISAGVLVTTELNPSVIDDVLVSMAAMVVLIQGIGMWRLTTYEPTRTRFPRPWWALLHGWIRFGTGIAALLGILGLITIGFPFSSEHTPKILALSQLGIMLLMVHMATLYFSRICHRVPDNRLARSLHIYLRAAVVVSPLPIFVALRLCVPAMGRLLSNEVFEMIALATIFIVVFLTCWWMLLLTQFLAALNRARQKVARQEANSARG